MDTLQPIQPFYTLLPKVDFCHKKLTQVGSEKQDVKHALTTVALAVLTMIATLADCIAAIAIFPFLTVWDIGRVVCRYADTSTFTNSLKIRIVKIIRDLIVIVELPFFLPLRSVNRWALNFDRNTFRDTLSKEFYSFTPKYGINCIYVTNRSGLPRHILHFATTGLISFNYLQPLDVTNLQLLLSLITRFTAIADYAGNQARLIKDYSSFPLLAHRAIFHEFYEEVQRLTSAASFSSDITQADVAYVTSTCKDQLGKATIPQLIAGIERMKTCFAELAAPLPTVPAGDDSGSADFRETPQYKTLIGHLDRVQEQLQARNAESASVAASSRT